MDAAKIPGRCYECEHCKEREKTSYMHFRECDLTGRMIFFGYDNGWERMKWCPLKEEIKEGLKNG